MRVFAIFFLSLFFVVHSAYSQQDFPSVDSLTYFKLRLSESQSFNRLPSLLHQIGVFHYDKFELDSAESYFHRSLEQAQLNQDDNFIARNNYYLGLVYSDRGDKSEAVRVHHEALKSFRDQSDSLWIAKSLNVIGNTFNYMAQHERAREYYKESLTIFERLGNLMYIAFVSENLAIMYGEEGHHNEAIALYDKSERVLQELGEERYLGTTYYNLALQYKEMGDFPQTEALGRKALQIAIKYEDLSLIGLSYVLLGQTEANRGDYESSIFFLEKALSIAENTDNQQIKSNAVESMIESYEGLEDYKKALEYAQLAKVIDSLLFNIQNAAIINEIETKYKVEHLDHENEILKQRAEINKAEIDRQRLTSLISFGGLAVLVTFIGFLYFGRTRIKKQKDEIERQASKLRMLDEFKSRFFANISHDIRTPLTLISGYTYQIKTDPNNFLSTKSENNLERLESNSEKLTKMADEIKDLILLEEGKLKISFQKVDINQYLSALINMFGSTADLKNIHLKFHSLDKPLIAHIDRGKFDQIIYNLISNAFKFTPEGGEVLVKTVESGNGFEVIVEDSGLGISSDHIPLIFERYYQSPDNQHRETEGLGIGLALVKELLQLHGGEVSVYSEKGIGTRFILDFPKNLDKPLSIDTSKTFETDRKELYSPDPIVNHKNGNDISGPVVMVVDDHPEVREYIKEVIEQKYTVVEAKNGKQALTVLQKSQVDLIVTDLMMPWLDGFELIERLKQDDRLSPIPVMVVSARTTEEDKTRVFDQGVNDFISKPFDPPVLMEKVEQAIENQSNGANTWDELLNNEDRLSNLQQNIIRKINQLIISRIGDSSLTVKDLADEICASERKTYRLIKDLTELTPLDYIKSIRFDYAKDLLTNNKVRSASEAAKAIGMSNVTQFNKQYIKHFGISPTELV